MKVNTASESAKTARKLVFELLVGDQPAREEAHDPDAHFWNWADRLEVSDSRFPARDPAPDKDFSHPGDGGAA